jgi:hypothetical protein
LRISLVSVSAAVALTLSALSSQALAAPGDESSASEAKADDVPAPPMALLFGIGAVGLIWGRRLAANARKAKDHAKPTE